MKVEALPAPVIGSSSAPAPSDAQRVPAGTSKVSIAIAEAPLPVVGAANAPPSVAARLDGAAEKNLRAVLAQLKEDVSPKSLQLAVNKLATHARQDVHAALKAMLGGHADAVATFVHTDHFDFARAELRSIAATLPARVVETTERFVDAGAGVLAGMVPLPTPEAPFGHQFEYELGQRAGASVGLAGDAAAFLVGAGMTGGGPTVAVASAGTLAVPGAALTAGGVGLMGAAAAGAVIHAGRLREPLAAPAYEARASAPLGELSKIDERHIFEAQIRTSSNPEGVPKRRVVGYHLEAATPKVRVIEPTRTTPDKNGAYRAGIEVQDPGSNDWVIKKTNSSFFPKTYTRADVVRAIREAYANAKEADQGLWRGVTAAGLTIEMAIDDTFAVLTAYPVWGGW